jgi:hypothetical protein
MAGHGWLSNAGQSPIRQIILFERQFSQKAIILHLVPDAAGEAIDA